MGGSGLNLGQFTPCLAQCLLAVPQCLGPAACLCSLFAATGCVSHPISLRIAVWTIGNPANRMA